MGGYDVVRTTDIAADPARVHALVDDFQEWTTWSPWEDLDPALERTYTGPDAGVGAHYAWRGNRKAGAGSMEITGSTPERIDIQLVFQKPFAAVNPVAFTFTPTQVGGAPGTHVEWRMRGEPKGLWGLVGRLLPMDKMVGKDFDKGLARLKGVAEQP
ncbi:MULTISPECIES: SRPBCC family protein [unclassified Nocardioides]|uniref:SRPBCC family protein n=1 Tax=unclassified Nocardioides TaxID=2615069 RepID=UPI0002FAFDBE|nr:MULTISPECIES: SRPBCC family protein [unclassified Nocardioides]